MEICLQQLFRAWSDSFSFHSSGFHLAGSVIENLIINVLISPRKQFC